MKRNEVDRRTNEVVLTCLLIWVLIWAMLALIHTTSEISSLKAALKTEHEQYVKVSRLIDNEITRQPAGLIRVNEYEKKRMHEADAYW